MAPTQTIIQKQRHVARHSTLYLHLGGKPWEGSQPEVGDHRPGAHLQTRTTILPTLPDREAADPEARQRQKLPEQAL